MDVLIGEYTTTSILATLAAIVLTIYLVQKYFKRENDPPGMMTLPILGSLPFLGKNFELEPFAELSKLTAKYGKIFTLQFGNAPMLAVQGYNEIREALVTKAEDFSDRPQNALVEIYNPDHYGIGEAIYNEGFRERRRLALRILRNFGFGKRGLWDGIAEEADYMLQAMKSKRSKDDCFKPYNIISVSFCNVICSIVFGRHFDVDDPKFIKLHQAVHTFFSLFGNVHIGSFIPIMRLAPGWKKFKNNVKQCYNEIMDFISDEIQQHADTLDRNNPRDFIDSFLIEEIDDPNNNNKSREHLKAIVFNLFTGGMETSTTTLRWALVYMVNNPTMQEKVHMEIESVLGANRSPNVEDRKKMPYTEAVINETFRRSSFSPLLLRGSSRDSTLGGYHIPKGTGILINVWDVHNDPANWEYPTDQFKPERFIDDNGQFVKNEKMIIFSLGRRMCLGEQLAKVELFVFLTKLIQAFKFHAPDGCSALSEKAIGSFILCPEDYRIKAIDR